MAYDQSKVEIELQPFSQNEDTDKNELRDEKKKKKINFSAEIQVANGTPQKTSKTVQFSKPQVSFEEHSSSVGYEMKACLIPNKKREEEEVMENLRKKVGEFQLDKNWKQKNENIDDDKIFDHDECETNPLLKKKCEQTTDKDFIIDCLCWHNEYRARHNVPAMSLSKKLCVSAQEWSNHIASRDELYYCPPSIFNFGQSIFCCAETALLISISGQEVATYWYSSIKRYDFTKPYTLLHTNVNTGHYTQLVWKKSKFLGVGKSIAKSGKIYVVAFYYPPGNIPYEFHENVLQPNEVKQETRPSSSASSYNK